MIELNSNGSPLWYFSLWRKPIPKVEFPKDELVLKAEAIKVPVYGYYPLRIPQNVWGILNLLGTMKVFNTGFYPLNLIPGLYELFYVDAQHRVIDLAGIVERARDNWQVRADVKVLCQVTAPEKLVLVQQPLEQFTLACEAGIKDYIRTKDHDNLVPALEENTINRYQIGSDIKASISSLNSVEGLNIVKVVVLNIIGDPNRIDAIDKANREKTELTQQNKLIEYRRENVIEAVRTERLAAEEQMEQQLRQAQIEAEVADKLWRSKLQQIQLSLFKDYREIQIEKIRVIEKAFEATAEVLMRYQMQGVTRNGDTASLEALAHAMEGLVKSLDNTSAMNTNLLPENANLEQSSLMKTLATEIDNASKLPYVEEVRLHKNGKNYIDAIVRLPGFEMTICCGEEYRQKGPTKVHIVNDDKRECELKEIDWNGSNQLGDVVAQFTNRLMAGKIKFNSRASGNDLPLAG